MRRKSRGRSYRKMSKKQKRSFIKKAVKSRSKSIKKNLENEAVVFVFYSHNGDSWTYKKLPKGWWWVGAGGTSNCKYPREEQFSGPLEGRDKVKELLREKFEKLKDQDIVNRYKIENSYNP